MVQRTPLYLNTGGRPQQFGPTDTVPGGNVLVGQVSIAQTALVAIALGIREVTTNLAGTVVGRRYAAFCRTYSLNGGATVAGRPSGYAIVDCVCNIAGQITVSVNAPALAIGSGYTLNCDVVEIGAL